MAGKRATRKKRAAKNVNSGKVRLLWGAISPDVWLDALQRVAPDHGWALKGRYDVWGTCTKHHEDTPSFHIRLDKGFAHCFGCHYTVTDPIKMMSDAMKRPYGEAFTFLSTNYGPFTAFPAAATKEIAEYSRRQFIKDIAFKVLNTELVDAAVSYLTGEISEEYAYARPAIEYLEKRGIPLDMLHTLPLAVVSTAKNLYKQLKQYETVTDDVVIDEIQNYLQKIIPKGPGLKSPYTGWMLFPNHISPGSIGEFRVREPVEGTKNIFAVTGEDSQESVGFYGLGASIYAPLYGSRYGDTSKVVIVEGEFDALAGLVPQVQDGAPEAVFVSSGGNLNVEIDSLEACGFDEAWVISDWDGSGDEVLKAKLKETKSLKLRIFNPPEQLLSVGKDVHDLYSVLGGKQLLDIVLNEENYIFPHEWALRKLALEAEDIPDGDVRSKTQLATNYARILTDDVERDAFITQGAEVLGLPEDIIKKQATPETDEGFIEAVCNNVESIYSLMYQENHAGGKRVAAWNMIDKNQVTLDLAKATALMSVFKADLGSIVDWVEDSVGLPPKFQPTTDDNGDLVGPPPREIRQKFYASMLENDVLPRLIKRKSLRHRSDMVIASQGIHIPDDERMYIVNGNAVYKGVLDNQSNYAWEELSAPQDEEFIFEMDANRKWSTAIESLEDLTNWEKIPLKQTMDNAANVMGTAFRFRGHELECMYLAAYIIAAPMVDIFEHVPWAFFHGPTNTGKSSILNVISSQSIHRRHGTLLEHSTAMDNFTTAGVKQLMRGSKLSLVLDEFEVGAENDVRSDPKHIHSRNILEMLRGGISQGAKVTMGSAAGQSVSYTLRFPFISAGISAFHRREDINRVNMIEMAVNDKSLGKLKTTTPLQIIVDTFGLDYVKALRHDLTIGAIQHMPHIRKIYREIKKEFSSGQHTAPGTQSRFREQLLPILAILKYSGYAYQDFAQKYTTQKTYRLSETMQMNEYDAIWERIMHTSAVRLPGEEYRGYTFTVSQLLNHSDKSHLLNMSDVGVYYLPADDVIAVVWLTLMTGPLLRGTKYAAFGRPEILRAQMSQDPRVLDNQNPKAHTGLLRALRGFAGRIQWRDVTLIPAKEFKNEHASPPTGESVFALATESARDRLARENADEMEAITKTGDIPGIDHI